MTRGRKALPDEIKALKGNPGKRRLNIAPAEEGVTRKIETPDYLKGETEKAIFKRVSDELNRIRFLRQTDTDVLGRWCYYMSKWISLKHRVEAKKADVYYETESKHGKMLRTHPVFASLLQIERMLMALEDRLGLNPSSRQTILRGLINSPNIPAGGLFGETPPVKSKEETALPAPANKSALGFLTQLQ